MISILHRLRNKEKASLIILLFNNITIKKVILFFFVLFQLFIGVRSYSQCLTASYGQYPASTFTPTCSGAAQDIATDCYAGEYSLVAVTSGTTYTFSSSTGTDYITIANSAGSSSYTFGTSPVVWAATITGNIRFYTHTNSSCGESGTSRARRVSCPAAGAPANNNCAGAITLTVGAAAIGGTIAGATQTIVAGTCTGDGSVQDVWYKFVPTTTGVHHIFLTSVFDGIVEYRTGACNGTYAGCADVPGAGGTEDLTTGSLTAGTTYYVRVYEFAAGGGETFTIWVTGPAGCTPPTTQATNFTAGTITSTSMIVGWTRGNGNGVLVVARAGSAVDQDPTNGTTYTASATFGSGTQIGTGNYVVYKGTGTSVTVTGLTASTTYYYAIYEYNTTGLCHHMTQLTGNATTLAGAPANDACANAVTLTVDAAATGGTIVGATQQIAASVTCPGDGSTQDVWYKFTTSVAGVHTITLVPSGFDGIVEYRTGACTGIFAACADVAGSGGTETITTASLTASTTYYIRVYEYSGSGTFTIRVTGPAGCTPPTTQATSFTAGTITSTSMIVGWTRGNGNGVLVVARAGSAVDQDPANGTTYTASATFGSGTQIGAGNYVVYKGTGTSVTVTGLTTATTYYYAIYEYNTTGLCHLMTELTGNATTLCTAPSSQATSFASNTITATSMNITCTRGDGTGGVMVVAKSGSAPSDPTSGTSYAASSTYGSGDACGGGFVVYRAAANGTWAATGNLPVTGLAASTTYYFAIYEYNTAGNCYHLTQLTGNATTLSAPPANNDCAGAVTLTVGAAAIGGTVAGATQTLAANCNGTANDDVWYKFTTTTAGNYIITVVGTASFDAVIDLRSGACNGANVACEDATLNGGTEIEDDYSCAASTTYLIRVYDYDADVPATPTFTIKVEAPGVCTAPATQASSFSSNTITTTSMNIAFTRGNGTGGVMVVARAGSAPSPDPVSGTTYFSSSTYGSGDACGGGFVVYNGTANGVSVATGNLPVSGLTAATTYYFAIYEFNSSGTCYNLTELTGNATTLCSPPSSQATSFASNTITATSMNITCTRGDGTGGVMVVAKSGSAPSDPTSGTSYAASSTYGSGDACGGGFVVYRAAANGTWAATGNLPVTGLTASTTYYFAIYEYNTAGNCYHLTQLTGNATTLAAPPANNDCPGTALTVGAAAIGGTVAGATQTLAASCVGTANDDVWYSFTTSNAGDYIVTVVGTASFDAVIDLRSGACNGSNVACQDGTLDGGTEILTYSCAATTTYLIRVYDYGSDVPATPTFTIKVECGPPAAPTSNVATSITCNSFNANWSTVAGATKYYLDVSTVSNFASFVTGYNNLDAGLVLTYNVNTNLSPSTTYYYRIRSFNGCASSSNSSNQNLTTLAMSTLTSNAASGISCNSFNANWAAYTGATSYRLDVSTVSNFATFVTGYNDLNVGLVTTYAVNTNLNPSTTYYYRVRAISTCGTSPSSSNQNLTTSAVATPTVNAETGVTCNSFNANWAAYTGATTYYLDVSTDWLFGSFVGIYNSLDVGLVTTYAVNSGLSPSTTYYYRIRAVSSCGTSPSSSSETVNTSAGLSAPSTNAASGITCNSFNANWSTVAGATKYFLDVSTVSNFATFVTGYNNLDVGLVLIYNVNTNLNPSITYYYRVRSYNACGSSSNSSWISLTTSAIATPTANAASGITCNSFNANWAAYTGATSYRLDVSTVSNFATFVTGYNDLNVGLVTTYAVNTNLNPSTTYYYRIRALAACGTSPNSANRSLTTLAGLSAPTSNAESNVTCTSFSANWSALAGATKYYLDVSTEWDFSSFVTGYNNLDVGNVLTYSVTGLNSGTDYYYQVRGYNACGQSSNSSDQWLTTLSGLSAPSIDWADNEQCTSFSANWYSVSGSTKYYLDVSTEWDFLSFVSGYNNLDVGNVLTYSVTGLTASTTYYYRVRAWNASCNSSPSSSYETAYTTSAPSSPTANAATTICLGFIADWNSVFGATKYYLDVSTVSNFASFVIGYNNLDVGNVTSYSCTAGINPSTTYYYRVRAYNGCSSANSNSITATSGSGGAGPANNECAGATNLTVGASCNYTTYTNDCATGSAVAAPSCGGTPANDVWFSATVPASGNVNITTLPLVMTDGAMAVYTGNCAGLTEIDCNEDYCGIAGGLMPEIRIRNAGLAGQTVRIRVWSESGATGTFKLCIFEPDAPTPCDGNPVATDNCSGATPICEANSYCGSTSDYYSVDMPGNMCQTCGLFDGSIENNSWLSFQANAANASLHVEVSNCFNGIQMGIYSATACNGFTLMSDIDYTSVWGGQFNFNISNLVPLTPGTTYYIMIDGYAGDVCDYDITPVSGISVVDAGPNQCGTGAIQLNATGGSGSYTWTPSGSLSNPNIANPVANPGVTTTYTVTTNGTNPLCPAVQDQVTVYEYNVSIDVSGTTDVTCYGINDGQSTALVTGGSGFTYSWNTVPVQITQTATGLSPGSYTVTITNADGCTKTANVTVDPKPQMNVTYNSTQCDCFDDNGTASVASILNGVGSFPSDYTITWNTVPPQTGVTATGLAPGASYIVTVVDNGNNGCSAVVSGNPITITSSSETGNTYKWYGNISTGWDNGNNWCRNLTTEFPKLNNHDAIIQAVPNDCIIPNDGVSYQCNNITINGVLRESGSNSKLKVSGNWINNGTFTENSGLITFNGTSTYSIGGTNPSTFGNLEIAEGGGTVNMVHDVTINKNLTLTSGTLDATASNKNITIKGNWINNGGLFNCRQGLVIFNGITQEVNKNALGTVNLNDFTFYNVTIDGSDTRLFLRSDTYKVIFNDVIINNGKFSSIYQ